MAKTIFNAIIFFYPDLEIQPRKYRNISNMANFENFAQKSGGWYINVYFQKDRKFSHRIYLQ